MADVDRAERWKNERAHFDAQADGSDITAFDQATIDRYRYPEGVGTKEFRFDLMGDLTGKRILDVGCNDGENSVLHACLGGDVVGVDISERSIELANYRASLNGVSDTTEFHAAPIETVELEDSSFDIIWCHSFLHHVLDELELVLDKLKAWCKPGGMIVISEPVSNPTIRRLRGLVPIPVDYGTPTERPLTPAEVVDVKSILSDPNERYFRVLGRLDAALRLPLIRKFEGALGRVMHDVLFRADRALLSLPKTQSLGGIVVLWGSPAK